MSSLTYETLSNDICKQIETKKHLYPLLLQYILEQSLLHHTYSKYYAYLVELLHLKFKDENLLYSHINKIYETIKKQTISENQSEYSSLCLKNKQIDQLIGYSIFLSELEMKGIIKDKIHPSINILINKMSLELSEDELYKCIVCLSNIFKVIYKDKEIISEYKDKLTELKSTIKFMKIKFKIMDILENR